MKFNAPYSYMYGSSVYPVLGKILAASRFMSALLPRGMLLLVMSHVHQLWAPFVCYICMRKKGLHVTRVYRKGQQKCMGSIIKLWHQITFLSTLLNCSNIQCSVKKKQPKNPKQNRIASRKCGFCSTINRIMSSLSMHWITLQLRCSFTLCVNHRECTRVHDFILCLFFRDYSCA